MNEAVLVDLAWRARERADANRTGTKVGCAIEGAQGCVAMGWNVEGPWMTSVHAGKAAVVRLVGQKQLGVKIVVAAEVNNFTPCGACRDWLWKFCKSTAEVIVVNGTGRYDKHILKDLCPHFPTEFASRIE